MEASFDSKRKLEYSDYQIKDSIHDSLKFLQTREYDEKLENLKSLYEQRIDSITAFAHKFYEIAQTDEVLTAMQGNSVSEKFANHRMRELYEETMLKECESTILTLQTDLSAHKTLLSKADQERTKQQSLIKNLDESCKSMDSEIKKLDRENYELKSKMAIMRSEFEDAVKRRDRELFGKIEDYKEGLVKDEQMKREKCLQDLEKERAKVKELEKDLGRVRKEAELASRYEEQAKEALKLKEDKEKLQLMCDKLQESQEKLQKQALSYEKQLKSIVSAEQKASNEALTTLQQKYKSRSKAFKKKILEQKQTIESLDQQLKSYKQGLEDYKKSIEKKTIGSQDDLKRVKEEWEKMCNEIQLEYQRKEAELQTKQQIQIVGLQTQYQNLLDERVAEIQREMANSKAKNRDIEVRALMEEKMKDYVSRVEYENLNKDKEKIIKGCEKLSAQIEALELEIERLTKEKTILEHSIEREKERARENEENNEDKKKRMQAEEKLQILTGSLQQYRELVGEKEKEYEELSRKYKDQRGIVANYEFELENERTKNANLKKDFQELKIELDSTESSKRELENTIIIARSQLEIDGRRKKTEGIEKYEDELSKHMETKTRLIQCESRLAALSKDFEDSEKRIKDYKDTIKSSDAELARLKKKVLEYDSEINIERITSAELQKKTEKLIKENYGRIERFQKAKARILVAKAGLKSLKGNFVESLQEIKKDNSSSIQDLLFRFLDSNNYMRKQLELRYQAINDEMNEEWIKKMQNVEENISKHASLNSSQYQEKLISQEKFIEALKNSVQTLKKEQKLAIDEVEKYKKRASELQEKLSASEKDAKALELMLKKNSQAFDAVQVEVKKETSKLQHAHETELEKQRKALEKKHSLEMQEFTEKHKNKDSQGEAFLRERLKEIDNLKEEEIFQIKKKYQELLDSAYNDVQIEKEKTSRMKQKLARLDEEIQILRQEHIKITSELEERVRFLDKHSKMEIEVLNSQLHGAETKDARLVKLEFEVNEKSEEIMILKREKEGVRVKLRELEEKVEGQAKNFYAQIMMKDKEIESLKSLVSRSYAESMSHVRQSHELDRETQELTKQARKGTYSRNSSSFSSEISKPI